MKKQYLVISVTTNCYSKQNIRNWSRFPTDYEKAREIFEQAKKYYKDIAIGEFEYGAKYQIITDTETKYSQANIGNDINTIEIISFLS